MAQRQTLYGYVNETSSFTRQMPGGGYVNETATPPPATQYAIEGPTSGVATQPSGDFISTADGQTTALVTVSDGEGGVFTPSATFNANGGTFKYTPQTSGTKVLTFTNNGGLQNQTSLVYTAAVYTPPASVTVVDQQDPVGQSVTFILTVANTDTLSITLEPNDGVSQTVGPRNFPVTGSSVTAVFDAIPAGSYAPDILVVGPGGSTKVDGENFTIAGVGGGGEIELVPPGAPTIGTAVAGDSYVDVFFTPPAQTGSHPIDDYVATLSTGETNTGTSSPIRISASNGTARTASVLARSAAGSGLSSGASNEVTPQGAYIPKISLDLIAANGTAIPAGIQLKCAWFDQNQPQNFEAPTWKGTVTTTGSPLLVTITGTHLVTGATGWLIATNSDGDATSIHSAFSGPVVVQ